MLRTNSIKVKQKLHNYLLESWNDSMYVLDGNLPKVETWDKSATYFLKMMKEEIKPNVRNIDLFSAFVEWCRGGSDIMPSIYNVELETWLCDLLEMDFSERDKFDNSDEVWDLVITLLYRECLKGYQIKN